MVIRPPQDRHPLQRQRTVGARQSDGGETCPHDRPDGHDRNRHARPTPPTLGPRGGHRAPPGGVVAVPEPLHQPEHPDPIRRRRGDGEIPEVHCPPQVTVAGQARPDLDEEVAHEPGEADGAAQEEEGRQPRRVRGHDQGGAEHGQTGWQHDSEPQHDSSGDEHPRGGTAGQADGVEVALVLESGDPGRAHAGDDLVAEVERSHHRQGSQQRSPLRRSQSGIDHRRRQAHQVPPERSHSRGRDRGGPPGEGGGDWGRPVSAAAPTTSRCRARRPPPWPPALRRRRRRPAIDRPPRAPRRRGRWRGGRRSGRRPRPRRLWRSR